MNTFEKELKREIDTFFSDEQHICNVELFERKIIEKIKRLQPKEFDALETVDKKVCLIKEIYSYLVEKFHLLKPVIGRKNYLELKS